MAKHEGVRELEWFAGYMIGYRRLWDRPRLGKHGAP